MSKENPYATFLDARPLETILAATPEALRTVLDQIGEREVETRPAPGKWSPSEIICHLADCEIVFSFRLRQTLAENNPTIQPFDQDKWAASYLGMNAEQALRVFSALRGWNLLLIESAMPAAADRIMTHPERGTMTFQTVIETMAGHDLNHLAQLRRIAGVPAA
jgi:DinB superfamily